MTEQFKILSDFKGFGNPNGKIWFMGLEEAVDFKSDYENILERYSNEYYPFPAESIKADARKYCRHFQMSDEKINKAVEIINRYVQL